MPQETWKSAQTGSFPPPFLTCGPHISRQSKTEGSEAKEWPSQADLNRRNKEHKEHKEHKEQRKKKNFRRALNEKSKSKIKIKVVKKLHSQAYGQRNLFIGESHEVRVGRGEDFAHVGNEKRKKVQSAKRNR